MYLVDAGRRSRRLTLHAVTGEMRASGSAGVLHAKFSKRVCTGRCGKPVDVSDGRAFFVSGERMADSREFRLDDASDDVDIEVRPGTRVSLALAIVATSVGFSIAAPGAFLATASRSRRTGLTLIGVGLPLIGLSIPLYFRGVTRISIQRHR